MFELTFFFIFNHLVIERCLQYFVFLWTWTLQYLEHRDNLIIEDSCKWSKIICNKPISICIDGLLFGLNKRDNSCPLSNLTRLCSISSILFLNVVGIWIYLFVFDLLKTASGLFFNFSDSGPIPIPKLRSHTPTPILRIVPTQFPK